MGFFLGIDVGTSHAKAALVSRDGSVAGRGAAAYTPFAGAEGAAEQRPEEFLRGVREAIGQAMREADASGRSIEGIGVSGLAPACLPVDAELRPLGPAVLWNDRRGAAIAAELRRHAWAPRMIEQSGNPIDGYYGLVKLLWMLREAPQRLEKARWVLSAVGWLVAALTGRPVLDHANAALYGLAFDLAERGWDREILDGLGIPADLLPPLYPCEAAAGLTSEGGAEALGLRPGIPVAAGTVDGTAVCLAAGAENPGDAIVALGTSALLYVVHAHPRCSGTLIEIPLPGRAGDLYTTVGAMSCGGALLVFARETFGDGLHFERLLAEASEVHPGCDGLAALPYFAGERTPIWQPRARGAFFGLTLSHTRGHLARALLESVAFGLRHHLSELEQARIPIAPPIRVAEGGARSGLWCQILADVLEHPLDVSTGSWGAEAGAAILGARAVGEEISLAGGRPALRIEPIPGNVEVYGRAYERYTMLLETVMPLFGRW